ncbi:MAG: V-type ATPase subunit [Desulfurococcales archaeon]|nr:V-type ATPase subunit [Desulfurococcales archaeon]
MLRPSRYALVTPKLRVLKAKLLTRESLRELYLSPSLEEALAILRDTPYSSIPVTGNLGGIQSYALKVFFDRLKAVKKLVPTEALPILEAFAREEEARDALAILRAVYEGKELPLIPTARIEGTIAWRLRHDQEALISTQRLLEALDKTWMKPYSRAAAALAQEMRSPSPITWMALAAAVKEYQVALEKYKGMDRLGLESIVCPYLQYKVLQSLVNAKLLGIPPRALDRILGGVESCRLAWTPLRAAYEREPGPQELLVSTRELFPLLRIDARKPYNEALEDARREALKQSAREALMAFAGYPFTPVLAGATAMLAKIEMINVVTILTGIQARLKPDEISEMLIVY